MCLLLSWLADSFREHGQGYKASGENFSGEFCLKFIVLLAVTCARLAQVCLFVASKELEDSIVIISPAVLV